MKDVRVWWEREVIRPLIGIEWEARRASGFDSDSRGVPMPLPSVITEVRVALIPCWVLRLTWYREGFYRG